MHILFIDLFLTISVSIDYQLTHFLAISHLYWSKCHFSDNNIWLNLVVLYSTL